MNCPAANKPAAVKAGQVIQSKRKGKLMKKKRIQRPTQVTPGQRLLADR